MPIAKAKAKTKKAIAARAKRRAKKVTIDDVWAVIESVDQQLKEIAEVHKEVVEAHKETEKAQQEVAEAQKEMQKALAQTDRIVGGLGNRLGSMAEHMMTPDLVSKFGKLGFSFTKLSNIKLAEKNTMYAEIDVLLENSRQAMVVEVKVNLRPEDVDDHTRRMEKIRAYADSHGDTRQFLGALSALVIDENSRIYALKQGFFIIEPSGEDVKVIPPLSKPKIW
jgi:hypothetical protein